MKVTAHVRVTKGYNLAISASQWKDELLIESEELNEERYGENYLSSPKYDAVVTVEFEVPDSVFERPPTSVVSGGVVFDKKTESKTVE